MKPRRYRGDDRNVAVDFKRIARVQRALGVAAVACVVLAFLIPQLQGVLLMVALFSWLGIGWVE